MPTGLDDTFTRRISELAALAGADADAVRNAASGDWDRPSGWSGDPLDIPGLAVAFDRSAIGVAYTGLLADGANPGPAGAAASLTIQGDHLAADERALRARYATPVRLMAMAAGRRAGHSAPAGVPAGVILRRAQDLLRAAQDAPGAR